MTPETADALIAAVRGATDELFAALHRIRRENPQDFERVKPRMLKVLSSLGTQLLEPACREHPDRVPKAIGGPLRETYSNRDLFLVRQNPESPNFRYGDFQENCIFAESREDVAASIQFKKIELAELERLGAEPRRVRGAIDEIARLESRPSVNNRK